MNGSDYNNVIRAQQLLFRQGMCNDVSYSELPPTQSLFDKSAKRWGDSKVLRARCQLGWTTISSLFWIAEMPWLERWIRPAPESKEALDVFALTAQRLQEERSPQFVCWLVSGHHNYCYLTCYCGIMLAQTQQSKDHPQLFAGSYVSWQAWRSCSN